MQARNILANLSPNPTRPEKPSPTYNSDRIAYETLWISFPFARQFHCVRFLAVWKANKYVNRESISSKHFGGFYRTHFASSSNCCSWLRHVCEIFATVVWWASNNVVLNPFCVNAFTPPHICEACFVLGNWRYCTLRQGQIDIKPLKYAAYKRTGENDTYNHFFHHQRCWQAFQAKVSDSIACNFQALDLSKASRQRSDS